MEAQLIISQEAWSEEAAALLATAHLDPLMGVKTLQSMIESGGGVLYVARMGDKMFFAYIVWINILEHGAEVVCAASAGVPVAGLPFAPLLLKDFETRIHGGIDRVRVTASRPGMERILEHHGYERQSVTYIKKVN